MRYSKATALLALCLACSAYGGDGRDPADGPGAPLAVFDAHGKYVGPLVGFEDRPIATVITANGAIIVVPISRAPSGTHLSASKFEWSNSSALQPYASSNCSGSPVIMSSSITGSGETEPVRPSATVRAGTETTAYIAPDAYSTTIAIQSEIEGPFGCSPFGLTTTGWLPASTYPVNRNYPEPLTIRMEDHQGRR